MDLKSFIANALVQISEGMEEARQAGKGMRFSPLPEAGTNRSSTRTGEEHGFTVAFDLAVAVTRSNAEAAEEILGVVTADESAEANLPYGHAALSRISFSVPVYWPAKKREAEEERVKRNVSAIPDLDISL